LGSIIRKQQNWRIFTATGKVKGAWFFEAAIPLKYLKLKDGEIAFNVLRYRPEPTGTKAFSWSLIPLENYLEPKWFGVIVL